MQPRTHDESRTLASREVAGLSLSENYYPPRLRMPRHAHEPASFSLVLAGGYAETFSRKTLDCKPSTLIFRPPAESHAVAFAEREVRIFRIDVPPDLLERMRECAPRAQSPTDFAGRVPAHLALKLYREFRAADQFSALSIEGLALELLAESGRSLARVSRRQPPLWLERAREMLHESLTDAPTLSCVAHAVGVHPVHLAHEFRKQYGASAGEYARRLRIVEACRLVAQTRLPLSAIATRVGFYDQSHFTNAFKRSTGMTPAAYRALFRTTQSLTN
ncbi:MAG: AraC family transcriptional regulator [Acidobacteriota bacterium]|jgi:AraC family transcriptional regulator|nr:AraC family transcriptional regulator [Acidobacteriota bacterium]